MPILAAPKTVSARSSVFTSRHPEGAPEWLGFAHIAVRLWSARCSRYVVTKVNTTISSVSDASRHAREPRRRVEEHRRVLRRSDGQDLRGLTLGFADRGGRRVRLGLALTEGKVPPTVLILTMIARN